MRTKLQILGTGCQKCKLLTEQVERAAKDVALDYELEKITDIDRILEFGIVATPALVVDGQVRTFGNIPSPSRLRELLAAAKTVPVVAP